MAGAEKPFLVAAVPQLVEQEGLFDAVQPINGDGGNGHFSAVFQARHIASDRQTALKFFAAPNDLYREAAFNREGVLLNTFLQNESLFVRLIEPPSRIRIPLMAPNMPGVPFASLELPYLSFEWLPGGNLESLCTPTSGYLDLIRRLEFFKQACRCVSRLHFRGCAHRDLKPGNFFVDGAAVKLGDFGTSRIVTQTIPPLQAHYTGPPGDFRYAPLEAVAGIESDDLDTLRRGDSYSLGALLYEMITGQRLYVHYFGTIAVIRRFQTDIRLVPARTRRP